MTRTVPHLMQCFAAAMRVIAVGVATVLAAAGAAEAKRVALVIGNSAYEHAGKLANPANDASDMAVALNELGFTVVTGVDLDNRGMRAKLREFSQELRGAEAALVFYAGHAVQVNGENYLAPIDTKLEYESDVDFETISMEFILKQMEREVQTMLVFLDACRDNPISRSLKAGSRSNGAGKGLAETKLSAAGTFLAFATDPGNVALDGKGRNSPFTKALLANIKRPGVEISTLMTDVRVQVREDTGGQQTPWTNSSLLGHFYFNPAPAAPAGDKVAALGEAAAVAPTVVTTPDSTKVDDARVAALAWEAVQDSDNEAALEYFLATYGNTFYGGLAKIRLEKVRADKAKANGTAEAKAAGEQPAVATEAAAEKPADEAKATAEAKPAEEPKPVEAAEEKPAEETKVASLAPEKEAARAIEPSFDAREVTLKIQQRLADLGCGPGRPDGFWGDRSGRALQSFARGAKLKLVSLQPDPELLDQLRSYKGRGCAPAPAPAEKAPAARKKAPTCSVKQELVDGACVAKVCPEGQKLSSKGRCFTPKQQTAKAEPEPKPRKQRVRQQEQVIIEEREARPVGPVVREQQVIVREQPVIVEQPRHNPGIGIAVGIGACLLVGC